MPNATQPPQQSGAVPPRFVLRGCVWATEHGPVTSPQLGPLSVGVAAPLGQASGAAPPVGGLGIGASVCKADILKAGVCVPPAPPLELARTPWRRVFGVALWGAGLLHVAGLVCLLAWVRHTPVSGAVGQKAVQMVFETRASAPASAPATPPEVTKPAPPSAADTPPMPMPDSMEPPPVLPPPVVLPNAPALLAAPPMYKVAPPPLKLHHAMPPMVHGAVHAPAVPTNAGAKQQPSRPDQAEHAAQVPPALASVAHVAKGGGALVLHCTPAQTHYPAMARRLHEEGEAVVEVTLAATGAVEATRLTQSTGYDDLDAQALAAARALHCMPPEGGVSVGRIPIGFHIH